jgi:hypothetical protein
MARQETTLLAFISSPSDVAEERAMLEDIVRELNSTWSKSLGVRVELIKWETHVSPGVASDAQQVINEQIGDDYDIFIGIMWSRFGTPTGRFGSGTEEEFEIAYARHLKKPKSVEIMFYFKDSGIPLSEVNVEQLANVLNFKKKLGPKGALYGTYSSREEFSQHLRVHLSRVVQNWNTGRDLSGKMPPQPMDASSKARDVVKIEDEISDIGFLDAVEISQNRFEKLTQVANRMTEAIDDLGQRIRSRTELVKAATSAAGGIDLKAAKRASDLLAEDMNEFVDRIEVELPLYSEASKTGIESWAQAANLSGDFGAETKTHIEVALVVVRFMRENLNKMQQGNSDFIKIITTLPRVTSAFNKARRNTVAVLEKLGFEVGVSINLIAELEKLFSELLNKDSSI